MERIWQLTKMDMDVVLASLLSGVDRCWGGCGEVPLLLGTQTPCVFTLELEARPATGPLAHTTQETLRLWSGACMHAWSQVLEACGKDPSLLLTPPRK